MNGMCDTCMVDGHDYCWVLHPDPDCSCCFDTVQSHDLEDAGRAF